MGMVINQGVNDQYFVFRGSEAREFISGLTLIYHQKVRLALMNGRVEDGRLSVTQAHTFCLWLNCEDLSEPLAQLVFDVAVQNYLARGMAKHGSA